MYQEKYTQEILDFRSKRVGIREKAGDETFCALFPLSSRLLSPSPAFSLVPTLLLLVKSLPCISLDTHTLFPTSIDLNRSLILVCCCSVDAPCDACDACAAGRRGIVVAPVATPRWDEVLQVFASAASTVLEELTRARISKDV